MDIMEILSEAVSEGASDIFIIPGALPCIKVSGTITPMGEEKITAESSRNLIENIYSTFTRRSINQLLETGDDDFSFSLAGLGRFRCSTYKQRNSLAAVLRIVTFTLPDQDKLHIPDAVMNLAELRKGMVLVTGPAGSGKSTTLACLIQKINRERSAHIITLEDPIEFLHTNMKSLISQREVEQDTSNYQTALRAALRQTPDVILLGEMRDFDTIQTALTAAETGQMLLSTLHTVGAAKTIDRIIDVFPSGQQQQIRIQLSLVLEAVVSQQLVPLISGGLYPVFEIMKVNHAIQNLIREGKIHQIDNVIYSSGAQGMQTMDSDILRLYKQGMISKDTAVAYASHPESIITLLNNSDYK